MSDKTRFYNMTRPVKFRVFKIIKNYFVLWCKALRERIKYLFNYILYKLNILNRYSYRDMTEQVVSPPYEIGVKCVTSNYFDGHVIMTLKLISYIDVDYFYRENKKGQKKIVYCMKDDKRTEMVAVSSLKSIRIKVGNTWYNTNNFPTFRRLNPLDTEVRPFDTSYNYDTITYDVKRISDIQYSSFLGAYISPKDISRSMLKYYYDLACDNIKKYLDEITLSDLIIQ